MWTAGKGTTQTVGIDSFDDSEMQSFSSSSGDDDVIGSTRGDRQQ